ncbi:hypothetical protein EV679_2914 [Kerstersia gyiorum]|uniref:Uncharacterized protein n=1 Tax=Kerstersia gyiorum TaxID=206506 RepID=A0A4Q7MET4_9BURK|nr:hypothetical protein [Kerstersia gyiorum]MCP1638093.1 hypothetical protein [Kerstersia gyiorum]MCP1672527.1 hypothetical protein [Kerstersia gyiorum]MCP1680083.1 hypothetical protein [Kerstersia gyiorum]MCP1683567.1 hypothetical protein [Kerstersia gyiorum]
MTDARPSGVHPGARAALGAASKTLPSRARSVRMKLRLHAGLVLTDRAIFVSSMSLRSGDGSDLVFRSMNSLF